MTYSHLTRGSVPGMLSGSRGGQVIQEKPFLKQGTPGRPRARPQSQVREMDSVA